MGGGSGGKGMFGGGPDGLMYRGGGFGRSFGLWGVDVGMVLSTQASRSCSL